MDIKQSLEEQLALGTNESLLAYGHNI